MTEINVLTKARSPYIVEFFGALHNHASVYICLEYMDAGSLEWLYGRHQRVPEEVIAAIAVAVLRGMQFLYQEMHIMHRDIKPSNILLNRQGDVKLCDFGISGSLVRSLARTQIGSMCYLAVLSVCWTLIIISPKGSPSSRPLNTRPKRMCGVWVSRYLNRPLESPFMLPRIMTVPLHN